MKTSFKQKISPLVQRPFDQQNSKFWKPESEGEFIEGTVKRITTGGQYNSTFYHVGTGDEVRIIGAGKETVLGKKLTDANVRVGDQVAVVFFGQKTNPKGKTYKDWGIEVQRSLLPFGNSDEDDNGPDFSSTVS